MPFLLLIWNNKRWTIIIVLLILLFWQTALSNKYAGELRKADQKCSLKVAEAIEPFKTAEKEAQDKANDVGEQYEKSKSDERIKTQTITRTVQKIVERPIYINTCFDDDGVSAVNASGNTTEP